MSRQGDLLRQRAGPERWLKLNAEYAQVWPNIAVKREPPADAAEFDGVPNKLERCFSPNPGQGDGGGGAQQAAPAAADATPDSRPASD
jgi:hypothetical protein